MEAENLLKEGDLDGAVASLQADIRADASNSKLRIFLFQLLCVRGEWKRAIAQLKVSAEMDASEMDQLVQMLSQPGAEAYLELLRSEQMQKIPQSWILPSHSTVQMPWKSDQHLLE